MKPDFGKVLRALKVLDEAVNEFNKNEEIEIYTAEVDAETGPNLLVSDPLDGMAASATWVGEHRMHTVTLDGVAIRAWVKKEEEA